MAQEGTSDWLQKLDKSIANAKTNTTSQRKKNYTEKDLKGIEVEHDLAEFEAGSSKILVAQDVDVLADDDDGDVRLVSSVDQTKKHPSRNAKKPVVAFSFADEEESEVVQKKSFRIGETGDLNVASSVMEPENLKFDATLATTTETIERSTADTKRKRAIRKKTSEMFTDEPTFQAAPQPLQKRTSDDVMKDEEDDDADISLVLAKSRQKNIELLRRHLNAERDGAEYEDADTSPIVNSNGMVVSEVSDFLATVKRPERLKKAKVEAAEAEAPVMNDGSNETPKIEAQEESLDKTGTEEKDDDTGLLDEPLVSKGVASTLAFLSSRGMGLKINTTSEPFDFSDIAIQYYDEFGNLITAKEAYKQLSHRFHGKGPGKNKEEKRLKKIAEGSKMKKASMTGDGSASLQRNKQKASGETHIMLAKGNKGIQTDSNNVVAPKPAETERRPNKPAPAKKPKIFGML